VQDTPRLGPTVYIGSYDGRFYALNAQSGATRWTHEAGGKISGSATIIGDVVYYSDLGSRTTAGLNARTGSPVFSFPDGAFNAVIADSKAIYLDGYQTVYQLRAGAHPRRRGAAAHDQAKHRQSQNRRAKHRGARKPKAAQRANKRKKAPPDR
jgi:outer membrane protein assembly factor BamB